MWGSENDPKLAVVLVSQTEPTITTEAGYVDVIDGDRKGLYRLVND